MSVLIGCDIEKTERFIRLVNQNSFLKGIYTPGEQQYILSHPKPYRAAAGLFCAKEAAAKALGEGLFGLKPVELEVFHDDGQPCMRLLGDALEKHSGEEFSVSISHADEYTMAVCSVSKAD